MKRYIRFLILLLILLTLSPAVFAQMPVAPGFLVQVNPPFEGAELIYSSATILAYNYYGDYRLDVIPGSVAGAPNALLDGVVHNDTVAQVPTQGSIIYVGIAALWDELVIGAVNTVLTSDGVDLAWALPVVQTSTLLDGTVHTDTAAQAATLGSIIVADATPDWNELLIGAAGNVLTVAGGTAAWAAPAAPALVEDNVIYVSKIGNDADPGTSPYTSKLTIQAAITQAGANGAAVNNRFVVFIYPGVYAEALVMVDYVDVIGIGTPEQVEITGINENPLITMSVTDGHLMNVTILMAPTVTDATAITIPSGQHLLSEVFFVMTSATNDIIGRFLDMNGGKVWVDRCMIYYTMTGTHANAKTHIPIDIGTGSEYDMRFCFMEVDVEDANDYIAAIGEAGAVIESFIYENIVHVVANNPVFSGIATAYFAYGTGADKHWEGNHIHIETDGNGSGYGYVVSTAGVSQVHSLSNEIVVEGFTNNWLAWVVGATDTFSSHFDDVIAASGLCNPGGAGTCHHVTSPADGEFYINGQFQLQDGSELAGDFLRSDGFGVASWETIPRWIIIAEAPVPVNGVDYTRFNGGVIVGGVANVAVLVTCRSVNGGVGWSAMSHPTPVADFVTYYWTIDSGNLVVHVVNDSAVDLLCTVQYSEL